MNLFNEKPTLKDILLSFNKDKTLLHSKYIKKSDRENFLDNIDSVEIFKGNFNEMAILKKKIEFWLMKKIVVTGGSGRFGAHLKNMKSNHKIIFPTKKQMNILNHKTMTNYLKKLNLILLFI